MKRITALVLCLLLLAAQGAQAIVDLGSPAVGRLWTSDGRFNCSATYVRPLGEQGAWILTAGHCADSRYIARNTMGGIKAAINWRVVVTSHAYAEKVYDLAIGSAPDVREDRKFYSFFAEEYPKRPGRTVYIHGFPRGAESVVVAQTLGPASDYPGSYVIEVPRAGDVLPGSSGSPVLDADGYIIGIVWGLYMEIGEPTNRIIVTPIEAFHAAAKLVGLKL